MKKIFALLFVLFMAGCSREVAVEVPVEKIVEKEVIVEKESEVIVEVPVEVIKETGGLQLDATDLPGLEQRKIIYRADLEVETSNLETYREIVINQLTIHWGYVQDEVLNEKKLTMTVRVPSEALDDFLEALQNGGDVTSFRKTSEDITNTYTTYEARKEALEARHQRLIELIEVAEDVDDIIDLERERSNVEAQLIEIGIRLTSYDSLVDYSTVDIEAIFVDPNIVEPLPVAQSANVDVEEVGTNQFELEIYNRDEEDSFMTYIVVTNEGEEVFSTEVLVHPLMYGQVVVTGLESDTLYKVEYYTSQDEHQDTNYDRFTISTRETYGDEIGNTFGSAWNGFVNFFQGLFLFLIAAFPTLVVLGVIAVPTVYFVRRYQNRNHKPINNNKDNE